MATFSTEDGYTIEDMMHYGFGHVDAARALFESDPAFLDSAGYLAHLGTEVVLKAWHLHCFGEFRDTHDLVEIYRQLKNRNNSLDIGVKNEEFLAELDRFYLIRYPRRNKGPVEVGSDQLPQLDAFLNALWQNFPNELVEIYNKLDHARKGGRLLMKKKVDATEKDT